MLKINLTQNRIFINTNTYYPISKFFEYEAVKFKLNNHNWIVNNNRLSWIDLQLNISKPKIYAEVKSKYIKNSVIDESLPLKGGNYDNLQKLLNSNCHLYLYVFYYTIHNDNLHVIKALRTNVKSNFLSFERNNHHTNIYIKQSKFDDLRTINTCRVDDNSFLI